MGDPKQRNEAQRKESYRSVMFSRRREAFSARTVSVTSLTSSSLQSATSSPSQLSRTDRAWAASSRGDENEGDSNSIARRNNHVKRMSTSIPAYTWNISG